MRRLRRSRRSTRLASFLDRAQAVEAGLRPHREQRRHRGGDLCSPRWSPARDRTAAARVGHLPLPAILTRLEQRLAFLTGGARDKPDRLRTLRERHDLELRPTRGR